MRKIAHLALAIAAGTMTLGLASPAAADSAEYFRTRAIQSNVPTLLGREDRDYYGELFGAIHRADWTRVKALFETRKDGPLHSVALAEFYLAPTSPRVEAAQIEAWLLGGGIGLPQAEKLVGLGLKRGLAINPPLPYRQPFYRQPSVSKRVRPSSIDDGTMPQGVRQGILDRITNDDPDGAKLLLDGVDASLSAAARAEWRQRIAWSYYIENRDAEALALASTVAEGTGAWVAEGEWVKGLAAWRQGDCMTALSGFERSAAASTNSELTAAALYWANRSAVRCRMPDKADNYLRLAAARDETLYGMLAAEQLGIALPDRFSAPDFSDEDWNRLRDEENARIAIALAEIGQDDLASEVLLYQAKIGDPGDYDALSRLARDLGLASTQLYMAHNAPNGGRSDPAARYPAPRWMPTTGWRIDPALAFAHTLQESNFRSAAVSPASARGLMQITPITVREHAPRLNMNASQVDLSDPQVNLAFGQQNLEMLRDTAATEGKLPKIMAAYNAGLTPVTRWNSEIRDQDDPLLYIESIPYWETRGYVAIVLRNYWMYERQAGSDSPSRRALASGKWPRFPGEDAPENGRVWLKAAGSR
jgi:soluble lytic murein transglycosylase-like protein